MSKPKTTYTATIDGQTFTTTSVRPLTHAVVAYPGPGYIASLARSAAEGSDWSAQQLVKARESYAARRYSSVSWSSRAELAAKEAISQAKGAYMAGVTVVEVVAVAK